MEHIIWSHKDHTEPSAREAEEMTHEGNEAATLEMAAS